MAQDDDNLMQPIDDTSSESMSPMDYTRDLTRKKGFWIGVGVVVVVGFLASNDVLEGFVLLLVLTLLYFLPAVIARKKSNASAVFVINLFLGWTLVGWVVALAMAVSNPAPAVVVNQPIVPPPSTVEVGRQCPFCAEDIKQEAIVCKHCGRDLPQETP